MDASDWVAIVLGLLGCVGGMLNYILARKKLPAENQKMMSDAVASVTKSATNLVASLEQRLHNVEDALKETEEKLAIAIKEIDRLRIFERGVYLLIDQLTRLNIVPDWTPPIQEEENNNDKRSNPASNSSIRPRKPK